MRQNLKQDYCWACRTSRNEHNKEDLKHAFFSCPTLAGKREVVLSKFGRIEPKLPATI